MAISRYGDAEESLGRVRILLDVDVDLAGRDVLLVEDIVDTGLTLPYLLSVAPRARGRPPSSSARCSTSRSRRIVPLAPRYVGVRLPRPVRRRVRARLRRALPQRARHPPGRRPRRAPRRPRRPGAARTDATPPERRACPSEGPSIPWLSDDRDGAHRGARRAPTNQPIVLLREREGERYLPDLDRRRRGRGDRACRCRGSPPRGR